MDRHRSNLTSLLGWTLGAGLTATTFAGCVEPPSDRVIDTSAAVRRPRDAAPASECTAEPSQPVAQAAVVVDGEPSRATAVTVTVDNVGAEDRLVGVELRTHAGGAGRGVARPAVLVRAGARVSIPFELTELGIETSRLEVPARLYALVTVETADGQLVERVFSPRVEVGPELTSALDALLAADRLRRRDLTQSGMRALSATVAAADKGDTGLYPDALLGPDEDGGGMLPDPWYDSAEPDQNGLYHYDFCFRWPVSLVDAGFGEDYGVHAEGSWRARGGRMRILSHGETLFDGFLDAQGCTGPIDTTHSTDYWFTGYGAAQVGGNLITAKRADGMIDAWVRIADSVGGSGTKHYDLPETDRSNLLAVAAFTVARFGGISGEELVVNDRCRPDGNQCCDCDSNGQVWVSRKTRKFLIAHEVGHRIMGVASGGYQNDCSLQVSANLVPCYNASSHAIDSLEYSSCAAMEGWAHFVSARAFNDPQDADASFRYWRGAGLTVDVLQGPTGGIDRIHETLCGGNGLNSAGRGVELDWLRQYWDYHTAPAPGYAPSHLQILDELAASSAWARDTAYPFITTGIEVVSGAGQRARWTGLADANGVDH